MNVGNDDKSVVIYTAFGLNGSVTHEGPQLHVCQLQLTDMGQEPCYYMMLFGMLGKIN